MYRFEVRPADHSSFLHILDESPKGGRRIFSFEFDCVPLKEHCEERLAAHVAGVVARHAARKEARAAAGRRSGAGADGDKVGPYLTASFALLLWVNGGEICSVLAPSSLFLTSP